MTCRECGAELDDSMKFCPQCGAKNELRHVFKFSCPLCGQRISVPDAWKGKKAYCPSCRGELRIPPAQEQPKPEISAIHMPELVPPPVTVSPPVLDTTDLPLRPIAAACPASAVAESADSPLHPPALTESDMPRLVPLDSAPSGPIPPPPPPFSRTHHLTGECASEKITRTLNLFTGKTARIWLIVAALLLLIFVVAVGSVFKKNQPVEPGQSEESGSIETIE